MPWQRTRSRGTCKRCKAHNIQGPLDNQDSCYAPGEFERLYADKTKIVLHYEGVIHPIEIATLPALIQQMEARYPGCVLRLRSIEDGPGGATVTLVVEETGKIVPAELARIKAELEETGQHQISALREALVVAEARRDELEKQLRCVWNESVPKLLASVQPNYTISISGGGTFMIGDTPGDTYHVSGQTGAVGRHATASHMTFQQVWQQSQANIDLATLAGELATLRQAMRKEAEEPFHDKAVVEIGEAQEAAQNQDGPRALQHLKNAGQWALDVATQIGVNLATEALKKALGS